MSRSLKVLSALLGYPTTELQRAAGELREALRADEVLPSVTAGNVERLIEEIADGDIFDLQERYVLLFDRTRFLSLHLFEHVHGESRDRGQAMIDLKSLYEKNGLAISATELPDFLPLFLEFLSTRPIEEARELLGQTAHILTVLAGRLRKRGSPYEAVLWALVALAEAKGTVTDTSLLESEPDTDPDDLTALDAAWEETPVVFGPEAAGNCKDDLVARIRAAKRPAARPQ